MKKIVLFIMLLSVSFEGHSQELFSEKIALQLSTLPLHCISQEFPNKTGHSSDGPEDHRLLPSELHPSFYGCLDWHSSVHGHWMLIKLLKTYPNIANKDEIMATLENSLQADKLKIEAEYFKNRKLPKHSSGHMAGPGCLNSTKNCSLGTTQKQKNGIKIYSL